MSTAALTVKGRDTRERIVIAASALFHCRGVNAIGLNEIARDSGTGKSQIYHYFSNKREIVEAAILRHIECSVRPQKRQLEAMTTVADLRAWADAVVTSQEAGNPARCPLAALTIEVAGSDPALRQSLSDGFAEWRTCIAAGLQRLQHADLIRADQPAQDLAEILLCAYEGGALLSEAHGSAHSLRLSLDAAIDSMLIRP